jgi:hypothetical protein
MSGAEIPDPEGSELDAARLGELLPYRVDLWSEDRGTIDRVLARVANATLAHAIFTAARGELPNRYITLRQGTRIISQTD